jgi:hypothetical protein
VIVVEPGETSKIRTLEAGLIDANGNTILAKETALLFGAAKL